MYLADVSICPHFTQIAITQKGEPEGSVQNSGWPDARDSPASGSGEGEGLHNERLRRVACGVLAERRAIRYPCMIR